MNVGGVGIDPEVMALRVTIEVQAQPVATHLTTNKNQRQVSAADVSLTSPGPACSLRDPVLAGSLSTECKVGTLYSSPLPPHTPDWMWQALQIGVPLGSLFLPPRLTVPSQCSLLCSHSSLMLQALLCCTCLGFSSLAQDGGR